MGIFQSSPDDSALKPRWGKRDETELRTVSEGTLAGVTDGWDVWAGLYPGDGIVVPPATVRNQELGEEEKFGFDYRASMGHPVDPCSRWSERTEPQQQDISRWHECRLMALSP